MSQYLIKDHSENQIYKEFVESLYGSSKIPAGYELLFEYNNPKSGFYGRVYVKGSHLVVATEGTDLTSWIDVKNDVAIFGKKHVPAQFYDYVEIYKDIQRLKTFFPDIKTTWLGYSLTGNAAQMMGVLTGEETICFSPLGAGNTIKHLDEIYEENSNLQTLFPNYKGHGNIDTSNITNYYCIGDTLVDGNLDAQIGNLYVVPVINNKSPHFLENWGHLSNAVPEVQENDDLSDDGTRLYGYVETTYNERNRKKGAKNIPTGYASNISEESECTGSYPVSGYTREDGTNVRGYVRDCYKHKGKLPPLHTLPLDIMEKVIWELI